MYLIVGLGNPGRKYRETRHNFGFQVVERWSRDLGVSLTDRRFRSKNVRTRFQGKEVVLLCPETFMNQSGVSVRECAEFYNLEPASILVIHDDLDVALGRVKVVRDGGAGGHRGVMSVSEHLGTRQFPRLKLGIGRPPEGEKGEDFVLSPFHQWEKEIVGHVVRLAVRGCELFVSEGIDRAMSHINRQIYTDKEVKS